jgi:glycosyltransferase involved in cell wall biosynthesis
MLPIHLSPIAIALLAGLLLFVIIQLCYHIVVFAKLLKLPKKPEYTGKWQPVSIIVCAQSEYDHLQVLVPALLNQQYSEFEIVLVDDASWDKTTDYFETLQSTEPRIKSVFITDDMKKNAKGKKLALTLGIKAAKHELLLFTDADCLPNSEHWITEMVKPYHTNPATEIVLGYSPFAKRHTFVNLMAQMENILTASSYFGYAMNRNPYMGVGRNLSYKKSLFFSVKGFANHHHIASGDDDLFIQDAANSQNTAVCVIPQAFVNTYAKKTFGEWFAQKVRHNYVGKYYKRKHRSQLGFFGVTQALVWAFLLACIIYEPTRYWGLIVLGIFWLIKIPLMYQIFRKLKRATYAFWLPLFDFLFVFYNIVFGAVTAFGKQKKW